MKKTFHGPLEKTAKLFLKVTDKKQMEGLLEDLLTPKEILEIAERIDIVKALTEGQPQRSISQKLGTSIAKITRGSHVVQYGTGVLADLL